MQNITVHPLYVEGIVSELFGYLGPFDLTRCAQVCKLWNQYAYNDLFWAPHCKGIDNPSQKSWYEAYKLQHTILHGTLSMDRKEYSLQGKIGNLFCTFSCDLYRQYCVYYDFNQEKVALLNWEENRTEYIPLPEQLIEKIKKNEVGEESIQDTGKRRKELDVDLRLDSEYIILLYKRNCYRETYILDYNEEQKEWVYSEKKSFIRTVMQYGEKTFSAEHLDWDYDSSTKMVIQRIDEAENRIISWPEKHVPKEAQALKMIPEDMWYGNMIWCKDNKLVFFYRNEEKFFTLYNNEGENIFEPEDKLKTDEPEEAIRVLKEGRCFFCDKETKSVAKIHAWNLETHEKYTEFKVETKDEILEVDSAISNNLFFLFTSDNTYSEHKFSIYDSSGNFLKEFTLFPAPQRSPLCSVNDKGNKFCHLYYIEGNKACSLYPIEVLKHQSCCIEAYTIEAPTPKK